MPPIVLTDTPSSSLTWDTVNCFSSRYFSWSAGIRNLGIPRDECVTFHPLWAVLGSSLIITTMPEINLWVCLYVRELLPDLDGNLWAWLNIVRLLPPILFCFIRRSIPATDSYCSYLLQQQINIFLFKTKNMQRHL